MTERLECSRVPRNVIDQSITNTVLLSFAGMLPSIFTFSSSGKPATVTVQCEYRTACALKMGLGFLLGNRHGLLYSPPLHYPLPPPIISKAITSECCLLPCSGWWPPLCGPHPTLWRENMLHTGWAPRGPATAHRWPKGRWEPQGLHSV